MSRNLESVFETSLSNYNYRLAFLVKIEFDEGTLAFSSTIHDIDYAGDTYQGFGNLGSVSNLSEDGNLNAQKYKLTLSGVNQSLLTAVTNTDHVNRPCTCYLASLDENGALVGTPAIYFSSKVDTVECDYTNTGHIKIVATDDLVRWNVAKVSKYTNEDQTSKYPDDKGFRWVAAIANASIVWPNREWFKNNS